MSIVIEHIVRKFRDGGLRFLVGYSIRHALSAVKSEKFILENMYKAPRFNARSELFKCSISRVQVKETCNTMK